MLRRSRRARKRTFSAPEKPYVKSGSAAERVRQAVMALNVSHVGALNTGQNPRKGGFSSTTQGQNADALFARELRGNIVQNDIGPGFVRMVAADVK